MFYSFFLKMYNSLFFVLFIFQNTIISSLWASAITSWSFLSTTNSQGFSKRSFNHKLKSPCNCGIRSCRILCQRSIPLHWRKRNTVLHPNASFTIFLASCLLSLKQHDWCTQLQHFSQQTHHKRKVRKKRRKKTSLKETSVTRFHPNPLTPPPPLNSFPLSSKLPY